MNEATPTCRRAEVLINRRLDRECSHGESTELDQHLASCPQCRVEYRSARGLEVLFSQLAVPDSSAAQARFKARMGELVRANPASKPITQLRMPASRRKVWLPALAALLAVALVGAVAFLIQRSSSTTEVVRLSVQFEDRLSILETLNERALQAASQTPGTELARTHDQLATDLAASILFESNDAVAREDAAISYIRAHTLALLPELQDGLLDKGRLASFQTRQQVLSAAKPATSTLSLATAVSAYGVEYLEGRTGAKPPFTTPKPGTSLQAAFSDAALAMRETSQPLDRAQILDQVAERVLVEAARDSLTPAESARLQNVAAVLSARGTQNQIRLASRDARDSDAQRVASLLKSDATRLEKLQGLAEKLPPQQQERVMGALAATRASNRKMQETLTPSGEQKAPAPKDATPSAKPIEATPQKTTDTALPPQNTPIVAAPVQVPAATPAIVVPGNTPAAVAVPGNGTSEPAPGNGSSTGTNQGKDATTPQSKNPEGGKDGAPGQVKSAEKGKDSAPGQIKKAENADGPAVVKTPPGQTVNIDPSVQKGSNGKERSDAASLRGGAPDKVERPEAIDRPEKPERPERPERPEGLDRPDRPEKVERADRPEKGGAEKPERAERPDKPEKPERPDVPEKPDRPDKPDKPETPGNNGGGNGNNGGGNNGGGNGNGNGGSGNNPNKPEKPEKPDKPKK